MKALGRAALVGALAMAMVGLGYPWDAHVAHAFSDVPVVTCVSFDTTPGCATTMTVDEGQWFTINVTFTDLDPTGQVDTTGVHFILIKLGSGLTETTTSIPPGSADANGVTSFSIAKRYLDNRPTADLTVKVGDDFPTFNTSATFHVAVTVNNVAPTATLSNGGPGNEGRPRQISLSGPFDPSSADTTAGFHYAFDCSGGSLAAATYASSGTSPSANCTYDDGPSSPTASARILDKDGGFTDYTTTVTVNNAAPTATFKGPSVNEGSPIALSLTAAFDPSTADTTAGFQYAFDCGDGSGYGALGSSNTASCATTDSGTRVVRGKISDKDGGSSEYAGTVMVNNVAPTATFNAPVSVNAGSPIALSLTAASDPSSADTAAGVQYAFDCGDGSGYGALGSSNTSSCATSTSGTRTVRGTISDKDGGASEDTAPVTGISVAPHADKGVDELVSPVHPWNGDAMSGKADQAPPQFASGDKDSPCSPLKALSNMVSAQSAKKVPMDQVEAFVSLLGKLSAAVPCTDLHVDPAAPKGPTRHN